MANMDMQIETIDDANFEDALERDPKRSVVVFKTDWYGTTYIMAPIIFNVAGEYSGRVSFYMFDYNRTSAVTQQYDIRNIITFLFFRGSDVIGQLTGPVSADTLKTKVEELFFSDTVGNNHRG
ncbi:hypothetical protein JXO52_09630 [bacterium]|nr:hypothetical protein [bacterium]